MANGADIKELSNIATRLRIRSIEATNASKSGHPTSCSSMAEIMSCLFFNVMHYNVKAPRDPNNDRFILSKGHAAPILYAAWVENGHIAPDDILNLRKINNDLEGHPTPRLSFVDVATGSLGQGASCAAGMAYAGKYLESNGNPNSPAYRVYCVIGDGESAEGSIWEALAFASKYQLNNLTFIFDVNRLGQSEATSLQHDLSTYQKRAESFGCNSVIVDGHNVNELLSAFDNAKQCQDKPTAIIAKTFKGYNLLEISDADNWHGKSLIAANPDLNERVLQHLRQSLGEGQADCVTKLVPPTPTSNSLIDQYGWNASNEHKIKLSEQPNYGATDQVATRAAYGTALLKIGKSSTRIIGLDGDTKNSTFSIKLHDALPKQFVECYIAEQNMVGVGVGMNCRERVIPFVSTFAAFFSRAFDQIRMAAISQTQCNFVGSHVGVSIGEDGPSQMGLEDLAMFRTIPNCVIFYPSDAVSTEYAVELAANSPTMCYIRTGRPNSAILYKNDESFSIGKAKVVKESADDKVLIVAAGVTMTETLKAVTKLQEANISVCVLDPFTIKPLDKERIIKEARRVGGKILTVEDHYAEGGIGEAVQSVVADEANIRVRRLCVKGVPRSGKPDELLAMFEIDSESIVKAVKSFVL